MTGIVRERNVVARNPSALPESLNEAAALFDTMRGAIGEIGNRCEIRREGGFSGGDVVLFLMAYFASTPGSGLKDFYAGAKPWWRHLASIASRRLLPSPPSMSRALSRADHELVRPFGRWLLTESLDIRQLLDHPVAQQRDAKGQVWHVFHFDPTTPALRQRALPAREGFPGAVRRADRLAKPGRSGRKRGEVVFTRSVLQHGGSGLWIDMRVDAGHGEARDQLASAVDAVVHVCNHIHHPPELAVTCCDGQWGGIPSIAAFRAKDTRFVTRCSRYKLLEQPEIRRALRSASWYLVPDSGSGPQRGCADVGWVLLEPGQGTRRSDGTEYAPERVRIVVTRYPVSDHVKRHGRGHLIDGTVYELFATDLDEESWPAEAVCEAYFARCGQENRFAQEDREFQLDRIYAYEPAGQELASIVGAFVWNWRVLAGFLSNPPKPEDVPCQHIAAPERDQRVFPALPVEDAPEPPTAAADSAPEHEDEPGVPRPPIDHVRREDFRDQARQLMRAHLPGLFQGSHLQAKGWHIDKSRGALICPEGQLFSWCSTENNPKGTSPQAMFRTSRHGTCAACPRKTSCRRNPDATKNYHPTLVIPSALAARVTTPKDLIPQPPPQRPHPAPVVLPPTPSRGSLHVTVATLLPAQARKIARSLLIGITIEVDVPPLPARSHPHPLVAPDARRRRHGRCTHAENIGRYALPQSTTVHIRQNGSVEKLARLSAFDGCFASVTKSGCRASL